MEERTAFQKSRSWIYHLQNQIYLYNHNRKLKRLLDVAIVPLLVCEMMIQDEGTFDILNNLNHC